MKGIGKAVLTCASACGGRIDLVGFLDGSASVRVDGRMVGVWEAVEIDDAIAAYWNRVGMRREIVRDEVKVIVLVQATAVLN